MPSRKDLIEKLEQTRGSAVLCYVTGDRENQAIQIGDDALPCIAQHLGTIGKVKKIDLLMYSRGGNTLTGFALANALREFADEVAFLVPFRAHSCATLIALSADSIVAGPFAQLSPIDPSITTPHNPTIQAGGESKFLPVSVEDVANFLALVRNEVGLKDEQHLAGALGHLCARVSPLALGSVYRAREQIGMLAAKLLGLHIKGDEERVKRIVSALTRELLSHDYYIGRREAKALGLPVADATADEASLMWKIYEDVADELRLSEPWNWESEANQGQPRTALQGIVQSRELKHVFSTTFQIKRVSAAPGQGGGGKKQETLQITQIGQGWKKV
jgi:hypothetical protein